MVWRRQRALAAHITQVVQDVVPPAPCGQIGHHLIVQHLIRPRQKTGLKIDMTVFFENRLQSILDHIFGVCPSLDSLSYEKAKPCSQKGKELLLGELIAATGQRL